MRIITEDYKFTVMVIFVILINILSNMLLCILMFSAILLYLPSFGWSWALFMKLIYRISNVPILCVFYQV